MKYLFYRITAVIVLCIFCNFLIAGQVDRSFTINVSLKNIKEGKVFFRDMNDKQWDSAVIVNGKFSFKGTINDDIIYASFIMNIPATEAELAINPFANVSSRLFYLTPGTIKATGNKLEDIVFSGSREMRVFSELEKIKQPFLIQSESASKNFMRINTIADYPHKSDSLAYYTKLFESAFNFFKATDKKFIKEHPSSLLSVGLLRTMANQVDVANAEEMEWLIAGLDPKLRYRPDMVNISKRMKQMKTLSPGNPALNFSIPDTAGNIVSLSSYRGKYVLVEFWASWCGPCRAQTPHLLKSYEAFKNKKFDILGVSIDDNREKWMKAIYQDKLLWTQVSELKGFKSEVALMYGITGIPLNFLVDPSGIIVAKNLRDDDLFKKLEILLISESKVP